MRSLHATIGTILVFGTWLNQGLAALVSIDDKASDLVYSNGLPTWKYCEPRLGAGYYVTVVGNEQGISYRGTWHEVYGAGASVSLTFTGTRVVMNGTVARAAFNTTVDLYIDDAKVGTYVNIPTAPWPTYLRTQANFNYLTTMADIGNLSPGQHTFKAVSVTSDTLFVLDSISYEPSDAPASSSNSSTSSPVSTASTSSTTLSTITSNITTTSHTSSSTPSPSSSVNNQPITNGMNIMPSDPNILYMPVEAWEEYNATSSNSSCLAGTRYSSTTGSYISYNFTDGVSQGERNVRDSSTVDPNSCSSILLFSAGNLDDTEHSIQLKVECPSSADQTDFIFAGIRLTSSTTSSENQSISAPKLNVAAIVIGVIGGLAGLIALLVLAWFFLRRQRSADDSNYGPEPQMSAANPFAPQPFNINDALVSSTSQANLNGANMRHSPSNRQEGFSTNSNGSEIYITQPVMMANDERPIRPLPQLSSTQLQATPTGVVEADGISVVDRGTLYTLPSYNEPRFRQRAEARDLSEADLHAISRRMQEFMGGDQARTSPNSNGSNDTGSGPNSTRG
ncbi:hypothetical protein CPB86DRAFT_779939 [Serendipita vermifera]|nr:hypothetical protein CPB86DRAFT_779939 [Serendipita vermifera]